MGPLPVTMACTKNPNMENIARRPFLISLVCAHGHNTSQHSCRLPSLKAVVLTYCSANSRHFKDQICGSSSAAGTGIQLQQQKEQESSGAKGRGIAAHLQLSEGVRVVSKTEGVEGATWVQGVEALNAGALTVGTVCLSTAHEDDLQCINPDNSAIASNWSEPGNT